MDVAGKRRTEYDANRAALGSCHPGRGAFVGGQAPVKREYVKKRGGIGPAPLSQRLWSKTQIGPDCWEWLGAKNSDGYPVLWDGTRLCYAYRIAYEIWPTTREGWLDDGRRTPDPGAS
jgi:hypothetical protein